MCGRVWQDWRRALIASPPTAAITAGERPRVGRRPSVSVLVISSLSCTHCPSLTAGGGVGAATSSGTTSAVGVPPPVHSISSGATRTTGTWSAIIQVAVEREVQVTRKWQSRPPPVTDRPVADALPRPQARARCRRRGQSEMDAAAISPTCSTRPPRPGSMSWPRSGAGSIRRGEAVAIDLGGVRSVPGLRRRDPPDHLPQLERPVTPEIGQSR